MLRRYNVACLLLNFCACATCMRKCIDCILGDRQADKVHFLQKIESSEARIDTFHQQSRLSGSSSKGDDGGKTTIFFQAKPTLATTEEAREPAMNVSGPFVKIASDLPKGSPSIQSRTEADPSVSCMLDGAAIMGRPHQGLFHFLSWQQC